MFRCEVIKIRSLIAIVVAISANCFCLCCFAVCPSADLTDDCFVGFMDVDALATQWLSGTPSGCAASDLTGDCYVDFEDFAVLATQWLDAGMPDPPGMVWVSINDPGVDDNGDSIPDHEGFSGKMSKYETTNAQYCNFLNAAKVSDQIKVYNNIVYAKNDNNLFQPYYNLAGAGYTYNGATNGGAARIHYLGGSFIVDRDFENHPATHVSWYGATAFCNYYGLRLPSEWEWQAVADSNGDYTYGCGTIIDNGKVNYYDSTHPQGTTAVGAFGTYGYGMADMAGNVFEWTTSCYFSNCIYGILVVRGGSWRYPSTACNVSQREYYYSPGAMGYDIGFRVCR
jgi:hypothetical protein